jgi:hypothetical protein
MSKLTKAETKLHDQACSLLEKAVLSLIEREFVLEHWRADATNEVSRFGAFFTPPDLAATFAIECNGAQTVIDLCAGIGSLSYWRWHRDRPRRLVCVERNPAYVAVGKKVLPEAEWILADVFALPALGQFELAISNPPFGAVKRNGNGPRYRGRKFEYHVIDIASTLADQGVFLIPRMSAPFSSADAEPFSSADAEPFSSADAEPQKVERADYQQFLSETGIALGEGVGIEPDGWISEWHGVKPHVEIVRVDFAERCEAGTAS